MKSNEILCARRRLRYKAPSSGALISAFGRRLASAEAFTRLTPEHLSETERRSENTTAAYRRPAYCNAEIGKAHRLTSGDSPIALSIGRQCAARNFHALYKAASCQRRIIHEHRRNLRRRRRLWLMPLASTSCLPWSWRYERGMIR